MLSRLKKKSFQLQRQKNESYNYVKQIYLTLIKQGKKAIITCTCNVSLYRVQKKGMTKAIVVWYNSDTSHEGVNKKKKKIIITKKCVPES